MIQGHTSGESAKMFKNHSKRDWVGGMALWSWDASFIRRRGGKPCMDYAKVCKARIKPAESRKNIMIFLINDVDVKSDF